MSEQKRIKKTDKPVEQPVEEKKKKPTTEEKSAKDGGDQLTAAIDDVLKEVGEEFVKQYVQRGGE